MRIAANNQVGRVEKITPSGYIEEEIECSMNTLTHEELHRYARHLVLPEVGEAGQKKLKSAKVLIVGAGGLGSPAAMYLAAAGIGTLGIVDHDVVDLSNLQRQLLHTSDTVGEAKVDSARNNLHAMNPLVNVETYRIKLTSDNALDIIKKYDIVVDASDNYPTRYLLNDACVLLKKPNVHGSVLKFEGRVSVFDAAEGPCYRCAYPEPPPPELAQNCADAGVLGVLPGIIGTLQATEAVKLILGIGTPLAGRMLLFDALETKFQELRLQKNPECPVCGKHPTITKLIDYEAFCGLTPKSSSSGLKKPNGNMTVEELKQSLDRGEKIFILDVREPEEYRIANIGGHLIPLHELPDRIKELDPLQPIVALCHHGNRSAYAVRFLQESGFSDVRNLEGGIDSWSVKIDRRIPRY